MAEVVFLSFLFDVLRLNCNPIWGDIFRAHIVYHRSIILLYSRESVRRSGVDLNTSAGSALVLRVCHKVKQQKPLIKTVNCLFYYHNNLQLLYLLLYILLLYALKVLPVSSKTGVRYGYTLYHDQTG